MPKTIVSYNVNEYELPEQRLARWIKPMISSSQRHSAEKKGYSTGVRTGTAFSRIEPDDVVVGCGIEKYDREGRILRTDYGDWSVLNCYFPSGTTGEEREFKMEFLADFHR